MTNRSFGEGGLTSLLFTLAEFRLRLIDHKAGRPVEEFPKDLFGLYRQRSFSKSPIHQAHTSVAGTLIYMEWGMPRTKAWMASLFNLSLRPLLLALLGDHISFRRGQL
jgi:hypothetical protein